MADKDFKIIIITNPTPIEGEEKVITKLLATNAADLVHIRRPDDSLTDVRRLIEAIPQQYHRRLKLHGHFALLQEFNLGGVHLPDKEGIETPYLAANVSRSTHSVGQAKSLTKDYEYVTLSPVYESISKTGYGSNQNTDIHNLGDIAETSNIIALGGVTPAHFKDLAHEGFAGAAILGWLWQNRDIEAAIRILRIMRPGMFNLQFITNGRNPKETEAQAIQAIEAGCRWVQIRMKDALDDEVESVVRKVLPLAKKYDAILLVDDRVEVVARTGAHGVHLGLNDMPACQARAILGSDAIIGSTSNTFNDMTASLPYSDYFGVGPYRFTTTKKRLAPTLGIDGYKNILKKMNEASATQPVVAIGGITPEDVPLIMDTGVNGVAVSGAITGTSDMAKAIEQFTKLTI